MSTEIQALIKLLCVEEDPDNVGLVRQRLIDLGSHGVPLLKEFLHQGSLAERQRVDSILQEIAWKNLANQFQWWVERQGGEAQGDPLGDPLEEGLFLLSQFCYPEMDVGRYRRVLDTMAEDMRLKIGPLRSSAEVVESLNHYLFEEMGFQGNTTDYHDPENSYLNRVMDRRMGIPITLSVIILLLAKRVGLPIVGVGLPGHFLTRYEGVGYEIYIDAFNRGRVMTKDECTAWLRNSGYGYREEFFLPSTPPQILSRMVRNLIFVYNRRRESLKVKWLSHYVGLLTERP